MFAKSARYFSDGEGVREAWADDRCGVAGGTDHGANWSRNNDYLHQGKHASGDVPAASGRNLRNVFVINPQAFPDAHFATFPEALVDPLIKCSTSDKGICPECGAGWARCIEESETVGWRPTCRCRSPRREWDPIPATVLDPFLGSGTTLLVARKLGRHGIGIELNPEYADMARKRLADYAPLFSGGTG